MFLIRKEVVTSAIPSNPLGMSHLCLHGEKISFKIILTLTLPIKSWKKRFGHSLCDTFFLYFLLPFFLNINNFSIDNFLTCGFAKRRNISYPDKL